MSRLLGLIGLASIGAMLPAPSFAQDTALPEPGRTATLSPIASAPVPDDETDEPMSAERAVETARLFFSVAEPEEPDPCADADADPDVIIVCRETEDPDKFMFERTTRPDTEVTGSGAPRARDPGGLMPDCETQSVCVGGIGSVPPPAIMVDFEALPGTPAGSDAARYGGPTVDITGVVGAEPPEEEPQARADIGLETLRGIDDQTYGP